MDARAWANFERPRGLSAPRSSHGPDLHQLLYGSEGNLGMIVSAVVKVHHADHTVILHRHTLHPQESSI